MKYFDYKRLNKSDKFEPFIMVADIADGTSESREVLRGEAISFFRKKKYFFISIKNI